MTLAEAVAAIQAGQQVINSKGAHFWLEHDKGKPVLMGEPPGYGRPVKHLVLSSEHFNTAVTWTAVTQP